MSEKPITSMLEVSAFDPEARKDPHSRLRAMREQCPIFRDEPIKTTMLTRYEDIRATVVGAGTTTTRLREHEFEWIDLPPKDPADLFKGGYLSPQYEVVPLCSLQSAAQTVQLIRP